MTTLSGPHSEVQGTGRGVARGSLIVALGLGITGGASVAMITLVDARLPLARGQDAFNQWWLITTLLVTPFGVFEAYLGRLVTASRAAGQSPSVIIGNLLGRTWMLAGLISLGCLIAGPWLISAEFEDHGMLLALLPVWVFILATQAAQRGVATGERRFSAIAAQLAADGILRIGLTATIAFSGHANVNLLAAATCVAALGGVLTCSLLCPGWYARPTTHAPGVSWVPILLLLTASVCPVLAGNAPAPWLNAVYHHQHKDIASVFAAALFISRIPTQFVSAAFGPLLSHLTHAAETGDLATFRRLRRGADLGAVTLGALFVLAFGVVGVWFMPRYTHTPHNAQLLGAGTLATLALASALMFMAVVQQAGLAARERWGSIACAWGVGLVALVVVLLLPASALWRATAAPAAAIGTALLGMLALSARAERLAQSG